MTKNCKKRPPELADAGLGVGETTGAARELRTYNVSDGSERLYAIAENLEHGE
jgi:hypothetical protein